MAFRFDDLGMSPAETAALAELAGALTWEQCRVFARDDDQAAALLSALVKVRQAAAAQAPAKVRRPWPGSAVLLAAGAI